MTRQLRRFCVFSLLATIVFGLLDKNNIDNVRAEEWNKSVTLIMEAPTETLDSNTIEVSVVLDIPARGRLENLQGSLRYNPDGGDAFSCDQASLLAGEIGLGDLNIVENKNKIVFAYDEQAEPLLPGKHTLFTVTFSLKDDALEGKYTFEIRMDEAYNRSEEGGALFEDIACLCIPHEVYLGERFKVTPNKVTLYEEETVIPSFNKKPDGEVTNSNPNLLSYDSGTGKITAKELPEGKDSDWGVVSFARGEERVYVTVTVLAKVPEPQPDPKPEPEPEPQYIKGDVNGDGKITATDYVNVKFHVLGKQTLTGNARLAADVNGDGKVTATDYVNIKFHVLGKITIR